MVDRPLGDRGHRRFLSIPLFQRKTPIGNLRGEIRPRRSKNTRHAQPTAYSDDAKGACLRSDSGRRVSPFVFLVLSLSSIDYCVEYARCLCEWYAIINGHAVSQHSVDHTSESLSEWTVFPSCSSLCSKCVFPVSCSLHIRRHTW